MKRQLTNEQAERLVRKVAQGITKQEADTVKERFEIGEDLSKVLKLVHHWKGKFQIGVNEELPDIGKDFEPFVFKKKTK